MVSSPSLYNLRWRVRNFPIKNFKIYLITITKLRTINKYKLPYITLETPSFMAPFKWEPLPNPSTSFLIQEAATYGSPP